MNVVSAKIVVMFEELSSNAVGIEKLEYSIPMSPLFPALNLIPYKIDVAVSLEVTDFDLWVESPPPVVMLKVALDDFEALLWE